MNFRAQQAYAVREGAARMGLERGSARHLSNSDETRYRRPDGTPSYIGMFTKGLQHDGNGLLSDPSDYRAFVRGIDSGSTADFIATRLGPGGFLPDNGSMTGTGDRPRFDWRSLANRDKGIQVRAWESQGAGLTFDLEGPDAQSLTMPPAPSLASQELIAEMAEIYWMALLRDVPFDQFDTDDTVEQAKRSLAGLAWFNGQTDIELLETDLLPSSKARRRMVSVKGVPLDHLFRGVTHGDDVGPYISQFMLVGNTGINRTDTERTVTAGNVSYGAIRIDQRVRIATPRVDYLTDWPAWLDVQNGADVRQTETYETGYRFITTPRDLATYVHYDALYEAYLNACLMLLGFGAPFDPGLPFLEEDFRDHQQGFAQFGGPHILSLVTEVATRALKAVRYQKFNVHRRLRPEAIGGLLHQWKENQVTEFSVMDSMLDVFSTADVGLTDKIEAAANGTLLLPMAFPEGSPMHPAYGAGHATVAGACVTILKAFFDTGWPLPLWNEYGDPVAYVADSGLNGSALRPVILSTPLTVEGELNKLASNISIGRKWAGVHYFTDYIESIRLGEEIAIGILAEQKLTYGENFSMTVPLFDGTTIRL